MVIRLEEAEILFKWKLPLICITFCLNSEYYGIQKHNKFVIRLMIKIRFCFPPITYPLEMSDTSTVNWHTNRHIQHNLRNPLAISLGLQMTPQEGSYHHSLIKEEENGKCDWISQFAGSQGKKDTMTYFQDIFWTIGSKKQ